MRKPGIVGSILAAVLLVVPANLQAETYPLTGWGWSDNIGWVAFDGVTARSTDTGSFLLEGWAWSENVGWLSLNAGVPSAADVPVPGEDLVTTRIEGGELVGWARFCAGTVNGDCRSPSRTDGWDGWVKFAHASYDPATGRISGHAWGSDVVGWLALDLDIDLPDQPETSSLACISSTGGSRPLWRARCRAANGEIIECPYGMTYEWDATGDGRYAFHGDERGPEDDDTYITTLTEDDPGPYAPKLIQARLNGEIIPAGQPVCLPAYYSEQENPVVYDVTLEAAPELEPQTFGAYSARIITVRRGRIAKVRHAVSGADIDPASCRLRREGVTLPSFNPDLAEQTMEEVADWDLGQSTLIVQCTRTDGSPARSNPVIVRIVDLVRYSEF